MHRKQGKLKTGVICVYIHIMLTFFFSFFKFNHDSGKEIQDLTLDNWVKISRGLWNNKRKRKSVEHDNNKQVMLGTRWRYCHDALRIAFTFSLSALYLAIVFKESLFLLISTPVRCFFPPPLTSVPSVFLLFLQTNSFLDTQGHILNTLEKKTAVSSILTLYNFHLKSFPAIGT